VDYNDKRKPKFSEKDLRQHHFVHHKSHTEGPSIRHRLSRGTNRQSHFTTDVSAGFRKMIRANLNKLFDGNVSISYMGFGVDVTQSRTAGR
jgi:hypothetical protein